MFGSHNGSLTPSKKHLNQLKHDDETMKRDHGFKYQHYEPELKFEWGGFTIEKCIETMHRDLQIAQTLIKLLLDASRSALIVVVHMSDNQD